MSSSFLLVLCTCKKSLALCQVLEDYLVETSSLLSSLYPRPSKSVSLSLPLYVLHIAQQRWAGEGCLRIFLLLYVNLGGIGYAIISWRTVLYPAGQ